MSDQNVAEVTWLTQEAYDQRQAELDELSGPVREEIIARIELARSEGDLRENGGYHAAKDEQGKVEARIVQLRELLRSAKVGEAPDTGGKAGPGMVVTVRYTDGDDSETFLLGSREETGHDIEVYSPQSPLGSAVTGCAAGDRASYETPSGRSMQVEIVSVEPYRG